MNYAIEHIVQALKRARLGKGLSQRALGERVGVPQGHISKIERGAVNLQLSSLIALARELDLELVLVPRRLASVMEGMIRSDSVDGFQPAYSLDESDENA